VIATGSQIDDEREIVGISASITSAIELTDKVAPSDCCVLIEGESGTGKELIARRLHARSRRADGPFIPVNCAGINETLFESQFFGHVRGAFTGAEQSMLGLVRTADGGTLLLDEVGEIPLNLQPKLLRVLQEQEVMPVGKPVPAQVDTRFVAATNTNLKELVDLGEFRNDLFHRLNIVRIVLPPLRERPEDVPVLLEHFSAQYGQRYACERIEIAPSIVDALMDYSWSGNVRELAAWVERLYVTGLGPQVLIEMLLEEDGAAAPAPSGEGDDVMSLEHVERKAIADAMASARKNQRQAARLLGIHRTTLSRKLREYNLA